MSTRIFAGVTAQGTAEAEEDAPAARATSIPAELQAYIDEAIGHDDYAPYVLDGQTAERSEDGDDWHDVVVTIDGSTAVKVERLNLFGRSSDDHTVYLRGGKRSLYFSFSNDDVAQGADGSMLVPVDRITDHNADDEDPSEPPQSIRLTLMGQADYTFSAI